MTAPAKGKRARAKFPHPIAFRITDQHKEFLDSLPIAPSDTIRDLIDAASRGSKAKQTPHFEIIRDFVLAELKSSQLHNALLRIIIRDIAKNGFTPAQARQVIETMAEQGEIVYSVNTRNTNRIMIELVGGEA